eukprot:1325315-Karenia_brevis.AAC.1
MDVPDTPAAVTPANIITTAQKEHKFLLEQYTQQTQQFGEDHFITKNTKQALDMASKRVHPVAQAKTLKQWQDH